MKKRTQLQSLFNRYKTIATGVVNKKTVPIKTGKLLLTTLPVALMTGTPLTEVSGISGTRIINATVTNGNFDIDIEGAANADAADFRLAINAGSIFLNRLDGGTAAIAATAPGGLHIAAKLGYSAAVSNNFRAGNATITFNTAAGDPWIADGVGFIGIRFNIGATLHYGWIKLEVINDIPTDGSNSVKIISTGWSTSAMLTTAALPVELSEFTATAKSNSINLDWATESELNNAGFEVQRSTNGAIFKTIDFVKGNGTTLARQEYFYEDKSIKKNKQYYYRLKQIDFSGEFELSDVVVAKIGTTQQGIQEFYPNPTKTGFTNIDYPATTSGNISITVYDVAGRALHNESRRVNEGLNSLQFDFSTVGNGHFFVKLEQDNEVTYKKLVIQLD